MKNFSFVIASLIATKAALAAQQPNILWVITDDQRMDSIAAFNQMTTGQSNSALGKVLSPNVDQLAAQGVTYLNTFNQNPSCAPTRAVMHTGRYSHKSGVYAFEYHMPQELEHWKKMVPEVMEDQGYQTVSVGKLGLYYREPGLKRGINHTLYQTDMGYRKERAKEGLYDWNPGSRDKKRKRDEYFKFPDGEVLVWPSHPDKDPKDIKAIEKRLEVFRAYPNGKKDPGKYILAGENPQTKDKTRDGWFVQELENYLAHPNKPLTTYAGQKISGPDTKKPLFAYLGFEAPHTPVLPPKEFRDQFKNVKYKVPTFTKEELASFPPQLQKLYKNSESAHHTPEEQQKMIADYYAFTAYADYLVGKSTKAFIEYSEKNNQPWMIMYVCGDHGWRLNEHGMVSKFAHFDIDLRNPIIVVSSDKKTFPAGKVVTDYTQFIDMAPTFYEAAGIDTESKAYQYLDGQDLAKVAAGKHVKRDYIIAEPTQVTGPRALIRTDDYKFSMRIRPNKIDGKNIKWAINADITDIEPMFYDLRNDPNEVKNLAFDPYYADVIKALREKLQNIVLGDNRKEVKWNKTKLATKVITSNFAPGADDGKIIVPMLKPKT